MKINKDYIETARQALIRLYNDSLELNDKCNDKNLKEEVEQDITDDFESVLDFIKYLVLQIEGVNHESSSNENNTEN